MRNLIITLLFLLLFACAFGQNRTISGPSRELTTIPFTQYTGGVVVFKALLDDFKDSLNFILDTGSGGISLDSTTATILGLSPTNPERLIRGVGGTRKVGLLKNHKLTINNLLVDSLTFHVINYDVLSALYGERIDGIVGYSVLIRYIVKIDYDQRTLQFCSNGFLEYPKSGHILKPKITGLPLLRSTIKDHKKRSFNYLFDIGAGLTTLFSESYIADSAFLKSKRKRYLKQGEGLGGKFQMYTSVMRDLKIGPYRFKTVPINIFDDEHNITSYPTLGGIIGNDIFRRFNCILNYKKQEIFIKPNKHYRDPFDYAYSGIEMYLLDGKVVIGDIPVDSPADKAGLKAGDEVLAINNKFGMPLDDLKQTLQSTTGLVKVIVKRNQDLLEKKLNIINIVTGKAISNQTLPSVFRDGIRIKTSITPFEKEQN